MVLTPDASLVLAFPAALIVPAPTLPTGLHVRPLAASDYTRNHLAVLAALTQAPDVGESAWKERFEYMANSKDTYYPIVIVDEQNDEIIATGTLFVEHKFIRGCALVGHIEDIAVSEKTQGLGLGKKLLEALTTISDNLGAYKTILDCAEKNEGFYIKCGYEKHGLQMARYKKQ